MLSISCKWFIANYAKYTQIYIYIYMNMVSVQRYTYLILCNVIQFALLCARRQFNRKTIRKSAYEMVIVGGVLDDAADDCQFKVSRQVL